MKEVSPYHRCNFYKITSFIFKAVYPCHKNIIDRMRDNHGFNLVGHFKVSVLYNNSAFVDKAPAAVVEKEREKMQAQELALQKLQEQAQRIRHM